MRLSSHRTGYGYQTLHLARATSDPSQLSIIRRLAIDEGPIIINEPIDADRLRQLDARGTDQRRRPGARLPARRECGARLLHGESRRSSRSDRRPGRRGVSNARLAGRASELAAAEERQRLAHELHDAVNQTLWTAAITAESLLRDLDETSPLHHHVSRLHQLNRGALSEMRALLLELRPADLIEVSMPELIGFLLTALECRRTLQVDVTVDDVALDAGCAPGLLPDRAGGVAQRHPSRRGEHRLGAFDRQARGDAHDRRRRPRLRPDACAEGPPRPGDHARAGGLDRRRARHRVRARFRHDRPTRPTAAVVATMITVVVADDHDLLREGVSACLAAFDDITVIAEAVVGRGRDRDGRATLDQTSWSSTS